MVRNSKTDRDIEQEILQLESDIMSAIKDQNSEALGQMVADDFRFRSSAGELLTKADFLKLATSVPAKILSVWGEEMQVNVYGEAAVLTGVQRSRIERAGGREESGGSQIFTDLFIKRDGRWLLVFAHTVEMLEKVRTSQRR